MEVNYRIANIDLIVGAPVEYETLLLVDVPPEPSIIALPEPQQQHVPSFVPSAMCTPSRNGMLTGRDAVESAAVGLIIIGGGMTVLGGFAVFVILQTLDMLVAAGWFVGG